MIRIASASVLDVHALEPVTPDMVFRRVDAGCLRIDDRIEYVPMSYRAIGAELSFDVFPRVTVEIE